MRVFITPTWKGDDKGDGGIRRVVDAQLKYLPGFGVTVVDEPRAADLIAVHGAARVDAPGVPMVVHSHGMYWEDYPFGDWGGVVNAQLIESMVSAEAVTAPSRWVAQAIARGMLIRPEVVYHGVDPDAWAHHEPNLGYVLWNKARIDPVSDPGDMQQLAAMLPDVRFVTTFGTDTRNVFVTGLGTYAQMRPMVQQASLYLATARETFGIGTLEALAAGVPIVGWDYGGQSEIVIDGQTGYLAPFGDMAALMDCVRRALAHRERLSANAIEDARARWQWKDKIAQYAAVYGQVIAGAGRPKVSVIVTGYNLAQYLPDTFESVAAQTMTDYELIVVDDCSTDDTAAVVKASKGAWYVRTPHNLGLSGARNFGFQHAKGKYVLFLDADDQLTPNALDTLSDALDRDTSIHIAYGALDLVNHEGGERRAGGWPSGDYSWHGQLAHLNQLPYCAMMRRSVLERSGGYRARDWRAEDASFWARVTSFGFRAAKVTDDPILVYRLHDKQKSRGERGDGDWTAWLPWRLAGDAASGQQAIKAKAQPNARIVPFGAQGQPPAPLRSWPVRHHQHPVVSVVIPVGPGHADYLIDALDSVQAQTFVEWECIVVNDGPKPLETPGHPWAKVVNPLIPLYDEHSAYASLGAGAARNTGLRLARAPFVLFLDADDALHPRAIEELLKGYKKAPRASYVYSDWATLADEKKFDSEVTIHTVNDYDQGRMLEGLQHAVTALIETPAARAVGGFDEQLPAWEDWDFFIKLALAGYCGQRVAQPLLIYRLDSGQRRTAAKAQESELYAAIHDRYHTYITGEEQPMSCCNGNSTAIASNALADLLPEGLALGEALPANENGTIRMEYIGDQTGAQSYIGRGSGIVYRAGREQGSRYHDVDPRDVEGLLLKRTIDGRPEFRITPPPQPDTPVADHEVIETRAPKVKGRQRVTA
jgi:glycosyltransferase involved in cell wall biosynthesis